MSKVAQQFLESPDLDRMINGTYKDNIDNVVLNINKSLNMENLDVKDILKTMHNKMKYVPDHIDQRNLLLLLESYLKYTTDVNYDVSKAKKLSRKIREVGLQS